MTTSALEHARAHGVDGIILAVDDPRKPLDHPERHNKLISHYLAYFPSLEIGVDWTARQFWDKCDVPMVLTKAEIGKTWRVLPFDWNDARSEEEYVAGSFLKGEHG